MCWQTRNSFAKAFVKSVRGKNLKPKKSRGVSIWHPPPPPSRLLGLKGAGLEYRRKTYWELEAKNQQVFFEAYNSDEK